jgi:hypothetical protein
MMSQTAWRLFMNHLRGIGLGGSLALFIGGGVILYLLSGLVIGWLAGILPTLIDWAATALVVGVAILVMVGLNSSSRASNEAAPSPAARVLSHTVLPIRRAGGLPGGKATSAKHSDFRY